MIATIRRKLALRRQSKAARLLAREGARQYRQRVHDRCDEMRERLGLPPVKWGKL